VCLGAGGGGVALGAGVSAPEHQRTEQIALIREAGISTKGDASSQERRVDPRSSGSGESSSSNSLVGGGGGLPLGPLDTAATD
jgi:hypothetical protein